MIVFDLKCESGHVFEAWFASSEAYERQCGEGMITCPTCHSVSIEKAVMAPAVSAKGNQQVIARAAPSSGQADAPALPWDMPAELVQAIRQIADMQAKALSQSRWVGKKFADEARAIHYGEQEQSLIHGTASPDEARAMLEEGIAVAPLLVPVVPPDQVN
jgi:hypothetical protein